MGRLAIVAACVLNQWALDFKGNLERILQSIREAKRLGARYRLGPELEICGYACNDHYNEGDTYLHSWQVLRELLQSPDCRDIVCDVGMPVQHRGRCYNCRVIFLNGRILLIRPKRQLATAGNYRENRWFNAWPHQAYVEDFYLPRMLREVTQQDVVPFGDALLSTLDTVVGIESCQELWTPEASHIAELNDGAEIIMNSSASHHELRKLNSRLDLVTSASKKAGCAYVYTNSRGCDGERVYYDGGALVALNGQILCQSEQFSLEDVEVSVACFDLEDIRSYRTRYLGVCDNTTPKKFPRINVDFSLSVSDDMPGEQINWSQIHHQPVEKIRAYTVEEEISIAPACWLWDYLRRSGQAGFFVAVSGGVDSSSVACIVFNMCQLVVRSIKEGNTQVLQDLRRVLRDDKYEVSDAKALCQLLLTTCYMGSENSSKETERLAQELAANIGCYHMKLRIDSVIRAFLAVFLLCTGLTQDKAPKFRSQGGSAVESLALQNIQARVRLVFTYLLAQLTLWARGRGSGSLLVLSTGNLDESLRGYLTKYDCSSGDLNPIGSISKVDLKKFIEHFGKQHNLASLVEIVAAPPTAELEPLSGTGQLVQTDEQDMGMTYAELSLFGTLRKVSCCGPYSMFTKLLRTWRDEFTPGQVAEKVKHFFRCYAINRHKMTTLTPSYHMEAYSADDNRYDLRPFLYPVNWDWQFACIDRLVVAHGQQCDQGQVHSGSDQVGKHDANKGGSGGGAGHGQLGNTSRQGADSSNKTHQPSPTSVTGGLQCLDGTEEFAGGSCAMELADLEEMFPVTTASSPSSLLLPVC